MVRILTWLILFFIIVFAIVWFTGGGWQKIKAAIPHYSNPVQFLLDGTNSSGEYFNVPGTPSNFPTLEINASTTGGIPSTDQSSPTDTQVQPQDYTTQDSGDATDTETAPTTHIRVSH